MTSRKVGVAGIIPRENAVLVLRRSQKDEFLPGAFDLPGGGLEVGESPEEGIRREVLEETGLNTAVVRALGERAYLPRSGKQGKVLKAYLLKVTDGEPRIRLSGEHDEYRWVSDEDLAEVFGPGDLMRTVVHEYFLTC